MSFIPVVKHPYEDELLYSWIFRLSKANGLSIHNFSDAYLGTQNADIESLSYDTRNEFASLYHSFWKQKGMAELYLELSTFGFESLFMTGAEQTRYINNVFQPKDVLNPHVNTLFDTVRVCPKCIKEDTATVGEPYIHRAHQYTGVCMCHKHGALLLEYNGLKGHACEFNLSDDFTEVSKTTDTAYAVYVKSLADMNLNRNISAIKTLTNTDATDTVMLVKQLMEKYPDIQDIKAELKDNQPTLEEHTCEECSSVYCTTPQGFADGWKCPKCASKQTIQERFNQLVKESGNGNYEVSGQFVSMDRKVKIKHLECGEISEIRPRSFLHEGVRCRCEHVITEAEARKAIEANENFKLVWFTKAEEPVTILHEECGREFTCSYRKFLQFPGCRKCNPKNMTTDYLSEQIEKRTNGEFKLIGEFIDQDHKIKVLHNKCGHISEYLPRHFYMNTKCPVCDNKFDAAWDKMFQLYLDYIKENGSNDIAKRQVFRNENLGEWCQHQRQDSKNGYMTEKRKKLLKDSGFVFDPLEEEWNRRFEQYKRYIAETGSPKITRRTDFEGEHLGAWVETQRKWYKTGKMSEEREKRLLEINPDIFK